MPSRFLSAILALVACAWLAVVPRAQAQAIDFDKVWADAETAFRNQDFDAAAAKLETILKEAQADATNPAFEMLRFNLGLAYLNAKNEDASIKAFRDCVAAFPRGAYTSRCHLGLGRALMETNKDDEAIAELKLAAADPKLRTESGFILAKVYTNAGRKPEAMQVLKDLIQLEVRTADQTSSAVEAAGLLGELDEPEMLESFLQRLSGEIGIKKAYAWVVTQYVAKAEELTHSNKHAAALALYRAVPPRAYILATQRPMIEEAKALACQAALEIPEVGHVGWDMAIGPDGPAIIEGNDFPGTDLCQLAPFCPEKTGLWPYYKELLHL